jgi:hypothetical protein
MGEALGLSVWNGDQAGPFQTLPYPGSSWEPEGHPQHRSHEYIRNGTAKLLTLFHPADGQVRVKGVTSCPRAHLKVGGGGQGEQIIKSSVDPGQA